MPYTSNASLCLIVTVVLGLTNCSHASLRFLRGRPKGGMLVAPAAEHVNQKLPEAHWFTQRLDHFDDSNTKTWQQRFFYNDAFHTKPDGPVFVMIGGEGTANPIWLTVGDMMKNAEDFGAFTFLLEHRFYGESHPTRWVSEGRTFAGLCKLLINCKQIVKYLCTKVFTPLHTYISVHLLHSFLHTFPKVLT